MPDPIEYKRPWLYPKQKAALFNSARYSIIEASTKSGKTVGALVWLTEQAMQAKPGQQFWWVAPVYPQSWIAFRRLRDGLPPGVRDVNRSHHTITLANGSVIRFLSGEKADNLYGEDVHALVIDEASRLREESWHACRTTITATKGPARIIGNVRGRRNWMYRLARRAEQGAEGFEYHRITAADAVAAGVLASEEIDDARDTLPKDIFRQLFYAEASDDEGNPFGSTEIEAAIKPMSDKPPVVWGWDLAKSRDWTVGIALDEDGAVCQFNRFRKPWENTVSTIAKSSGEVPTLIDSTGVGDPIVERLQNENPGVFEGYVFTAPSKQRLMEGLAVAIDHNDVGYPEGPIAIELRQFEYVYTRTGVRYGAPEGSHDDCVCSLALATAMRERGNRMQSWGVVVEQQREQETPEEYFYEA